MTLALRQEATSYSSSDAPIVMRPGFAEQAMVVVTTFVLRHGLPIDWLRTVQENAQQEGNLKMVIAQLGLMGFAFLRVAGSFDWLVRVVKLEPSVFLFALFALASLFWSADPEESLRQGVVLMTITVYAAYLVLRFSLDELIRLFGTMFAIGAACNMILVLALPLYGESPAGWVGVFYNKNALGFACVIATPVLIAAGRSAAKWRFFYYFFVPIQVVLLIGSESKTMLVAGAGSVGLMAVYRLFRGRRTFRGAVMLSLFGSSAFTVLFATANIAILARWLDKDVTLTGRVPLWQDLWPYVFEQPFFGFGFRAAFGGYFSPMHDLWIMNPWEPRHPHNALYFIVLDLGLVGLTIFLVSYFRSLKRAVHCVNLVPGIIGIWPLTLLSTALLIGITESGIKKLVQGDDEAGEIDMSQSEVRDEDRFLPAGSFGLVGSDVR